MSKTEQEDQDEDVNTKLPQFKQDFGTDRYKDNPSRRQLALEIMAWHKGPSCSEEEERHCV